MFYIKAQLTDDIQINVDIYEDQIFTKCPDCEVEIQADNDLLISVLKDGDLSSTSIICEQCTRTRKKNGKKL
ncbi:hypothetical protein BkAM31D_21280 [Halalkalibacter krulwichiae]|uniref:Uncharacterized protein n=1 Tax=Halalkalibacter krulwichiae TaxID=199441 RepID=A0A1X9MFE1_9BACI|nr:hypothetical protein BkAM31D_21280 [Halalkalibacter krulwichiae]